MDASPSGERDMKLPTRRGTAAADAFRPLWLGQTVSSLGTHVSMVALPLIAVLALHVGPLELGILAALETIPYLVLSLPAGVIVDRFDHRATMIACDIGRAVALGVAAIALALGSASIGLLYVVAIVVGSLSVFFTVACSSYLAVILPADRLVAGNQRLELSDSGARIAGPSIGGALVEFAGGAVAVVLDAASYVVSAIALMSSPRRVRPRQPASKRIGLLDGIVVGLRRVAGDRILRDLAGSTAVFNLGSGMVLAVIVLFATRDVGLDAAGFGLVYGIGNVGFVLGAIVVGASTSRFGVGRSLLATAYLSAVAMVLIAVAGPGPGMILLLAGRFVGAVATPVYNVNVLSLRQARVDDEIMGRVNGTFQFVEWGILPIGSLLGGAIAEVFGARAALDAAAVCGILSAVWLTFSPAQRLTSLADARADVPAEGSRGEREPDPPHLPPLVA
jgi:MFS family permease